jgi:hypothetical protein
MVVNHICRSRMSPLIGFNPRDMPGKVLDSKICVNDERQRYPAQGRCNLFLQAASHNSRMRFARTVVEIAERRPALAAE